MAPSSVKRIDKLQPVEAETHDRGTVRLGDGIISGDFPQLRLPKAEIADRGTVRLGDGIISGDFPRHS